MIKQVCAAVFALGLCAGFAQAQSACEKQAAEKRLSGAAKNSFVKKCDKDAAGSGAAAQCEQKAADKKLSGAAKNSFVTKCVKDASGAGK